MGKYNSSLTKVSKAKNLFKNVRLTKTKTKQLPLISKLPGWLQKKQKKVHYLLSKASQFSIFPIMAQKEKGSICTTH